MQLPPPEVLASWPAPNHKDPATRGSANLVINILFFLFALFVVCLRLYARIKISKSFGWDDGLIVAAMFPATAFAIIGMLTATRFEWERHIWDVDLGFIQIGAELSIITEILFAFATNLTKLSLLALIYRITSKGPAYLWKLIIGAMLFIVAQCLAFVLAVLFQCGRPSAYWTLNFEKQTCISETKNLLAAGIVNTVTDLLVVILPMPMVYRLQLPTQQQIAVIVLFGVGFLVTLAGAVRTAFLFRTTTSFDKTWLAYPVYIASSVELYIGIICASIPATKTFFSHFTSRLLPDGILPGKNRSQSTKTTAVTISHPSRMDSVTIGAYGRVNPSQKYHDDESATYLSRSYSRTVPIQVQLVAVATPEHIERRLGLADARSNMMYKVSSVEGYEERVGPIRPFRPNPMVLPHPPPSYRNIKRNKRWIDSKLI